MTFYPFPATASPAVFQPADPSTTISSTLVMMGYGSTVVFTPAATGIVRITFTGVFFDSSAETGAFGGRYGTGAAPGNGVAVTGTRWGGSEDAAIGPAGASRPGAIALTDLLTLTTGQQYWFDIAVHGTAGNVNTRNASFVIYEYSSLFV